MSFERVEQTLQADLHERRQQQRYRSQLLVDSPQGRELNLDGRCLLNFASNDYLGLASDPRLQQAMKKAVDQWGVGSGSAHLVCGHSRAHHVLEEELADFVGAPRALLFSTGYMANLGVLSALCGRHDSILQDRLNHASLLDGAKLSGAKLLRYRHADVEDMRSRAQQTKSLRLIATDTIFSMDGDGAPVQHIQQLADEQSCWALFDEAHAIGVSGRQGRGLACVSDKNWPQNRIVMGTLGKAVGVTGAFVAGSELLIESLIHKARSYIYTTAMPPAVAATVSASLRIIRHADDKRQHLAELIQYWRAGAQQSGLNLLPSDSAIQPLLLGSSARVRYYSRQLQQRALLVGAIRPPTVARGSARLRITLTAAHTKAHVDRLLSALCEIQQQESGHENVA
ncbi:MAG: 8-amino-7-oxononanoate synthase [gamma proteobacterium symbiont of Bathyaustriella thionipta]|nr:8-amino-7-oxononanoate synthase [gamma proteobacterium symbiont of Bathyaustriella thionipta]